MNALALERPWVLGAGLLIAAAVAVLAARRRPSGLSPARHAAAAALRVLGIVAASLLAASPLVSGTAAGDRRLLVAAAGTAEVPPPVAPGEEIVLRRGPDLPAAIAAALASRGVAGADRLIVLAGDEGPRAAAAAAAIRDAAASGLPVLVGPLPPPPAPPASDAPPAPWLRGIALPPAPSAGVPFRLGLDLAPAAREERGGVIEISVDGAPPVRVDPAADAGPVITLAAGPHLLVATARDAGGTPRGFASGLLQVPGPPAVLAVESGAAPSAFVRALEAAGIPVERVAPGAEDRALPRAAVVVLGEGAAGSAALEAAVRHGTGLLVLGAPEDARGLGRLRDSPVATALPVFLPPPALHPDPEVPPTPPEEPPPGKDPGVRVDEGERPGAVITLLIVVDASGSMGGVKLEMARRAAAAAAATLAPEDRFGLISFADAPRWEIPLGPAGDSARLNQALRSLRPGGGTRLLPALQEARRALRAEKTAVRHALVMSDGEAPSFGLRAVVDGMVSEGATLSTVGIGAEFDARLMGNLASWGRGRSWPALDPAAIPEVVTLDTRRIVQAGKEATAKAKPTDLPAPPKQSPKPEPKREPPPDKPKPPKDDRVAVAAADPCALIEGLGPWPAARPPEAAPEPRLATTLALRFEGNRGPALVLGRHGLGRTAALALDPADWAASDSFAPFAARLARGLAPATGGPAVALLGAEASGDGARVRFELAGTGVAAAPGVVALHTSGDTPSPVPVEREGARRFAALVPPGPAGPRTLVVRAAGPDGPAVPLAWFDSGPPPPAVPDPAAPRRLAEAAGVPFVEGALPPPTPVQGGPTRPVPGGAWLAALAALLLAADAGLRRAGRG